MDPLFVDPNGPDNHAGTQDDDFRLDFHSPCINAGDNAVVPNDILDLDRNQDSNEPMPFDYGGNPRILGRTVDIGAFENG